MDHQRLYLGTKKHPITSYGIILYTITNGEPKFLIAQRRNTIPYVDFIRGCFITNHRHYFELMTERERQQLLTYPFDVIWNDLWVNKSSRIYDYETRRARPAFERNKEDMYRLIHETKSIVSEPPWGFPKGKKRTREPPRDAALREFEEETHISRELVRLNRGRPLVEVFQGSNGKFYKTVYYIADCDHELEFKYIKLDGGLRSQTISEEMCDLRWATLAEAKEKLNGARQEMLNTLWLRIMHPDS